MNMARTRTFMHWNNVQINPCYRCGSSKDSIHCCEGERRGESITRRVGEQCRKSIDCCLNKHYRSRYPWRGLWYSGWERSQWRSRWRYWVHCLNRKTESLLQEHLRHNVHTSQLVRNLSILLVSERNLKSPTLIGSTTDQELKRSIVSLSELRIFTIINNS